jgi:hypothetical protein
VPECHLATFLRLQLGHRRSAGLLDLLFVELGVVHILLALRVRARPVQFHQRNSRGENTKIETAVAAGRAGERPG